MADHAENVMEWIPPNPDAEEWTDNFESLITEIEREFGVKKEYIEGMMDPNECELDGPDELKDLWVSLHDEDEEYFKLSVVASSTSPTSPAQSDNELGADDNILSFLNLQLPTQNVQLTALAQNVQLSALEEEEEEDGSDDSVEINKRNRDVDLDALAKVNYDSR